MRIRLHCSASDEYWPLMTLTAANRAEYCVRWGIDLDLRKYDPSLSLTYQRTDFELDALQHCDWLWFMGVDTCITNMTVDVRKLITDHGNIDVLIGDDTWGINNDSTFIRNCPQSITWLKNVRKDLDKMSDQDSMAQWFSKMPELHVKHVCHKLFNAYPVRHEYADPGYWDPGDFVAHWPGIPNEYRLPYVTEILKQVVR